MEDRTHKPNLGQSGVHSPLMEQEVDKLEGVKRYKELLDAEMGAGQAGSRIPLKFFLPALGVGAVVIGLVVGLSSKGGDSTNPEMAPPKREPPVSIDEAAVSGDSAMEVARKFLKATSAEERVALVRNADTVRENLRSYPAAVIAYPIAFSSLVQMGPASASGELRFQRFTVTICDGSRRLLCVAQTSAGPLVDYDAFARYGTAEREDLLDGESGEQLRLVVKPSFYYNHGFSDDEVWTAFDLSSPDWPDSLTGYARSESSTAGVLTEILRNAPKQRVTLKIRPEAESYRKRQFVIEKILASGWVMTQGDIEARWLMRKEELAKSARR